MQSPVASQMHLTQSDAPRMSWMQVMMPWASVMCPQSFIAAWISLLQARVSCRVQEVFSRGLAWAARARAQRAARRRRDLILAGPDKEKTSCTLQETLACNNEIQAAMNDP